MRLWIAFILFAALVGVVLGVVAKGDREEAAAADAPGLQEAADPSGGKPGRLSVLAVDSRTAPVADFDLIVRNVKGDDVAEHRTDEGGKASVEDLPRELLHVHAPALRRDVGTADLRDGSKSLTLDIPAVRRLNVRMRVDGCLAVPETIDLHVSGGLIVSKKPGSDPGTISVQARPFDGEGDLEVLLKARGITPQRIVLKPSSVSQPRLWSLAVETSHSLSLQVNPPADGVYQLELHRYDEISGAWSHTTAVETTGGKGGPAGAHQLEGLRTARYRVLDLRSGIATKPIDIGAKPNAKATLDLSAVISVHGRVTYEDADTIDGARVLVAGAVPSLHPYARHGIPVLRTGAFQARVKAGEPYKLTPWHPVLMPAEIGGSFAGTTAPEDLELRMVMGPQVAFNLDPSFVQTSRYRDKRFHVYAFAPGGTKPIAVCEPMAAKSGGFRFGGLGHGRYTLLFHVPGRAPLTLEDVAIDGNTVSLGVIRAGNSAQLQVGFVAEPGRKVPRINIRAVSLSKPRYVREVPGDGRRSSMVQGLGAGLFSVSFTDEKGRPVAACQKVKVGAGQSVNVSVDLRD